MGALGNKRALVVGAGGLGCPAALGLAGAGVGALTLVDHDVVEVHNLHRQLLHKDADLGRPKVDSAREALEQAFPHLKLSALRRRVDEGNVDDLFREHDLVIDGTDGIDVKFLLSDAAVRTGTPLVHGGVLRLHGQAMLIRPGGPCLRCLFEAPPTEADLPTCAQAGVLGSVAGIIGFVQARIGVDHLLGEAQMEGVTPLTVFDGHALSGRTLKVRRAADCPACGAGSEAEAHPG